MGKRKFRRTVTCLSHPGDGFKPSESLLNKFSLSLTDFICLMTSGALIESFSVLATSNMWNNISSSQLFYKFLSMISLICSKSGFCMSRLSDIRTLGEEKFDIIIL